MQLIDSLNLLHKVGYTHNDIKPSNIMLNFNEDGVYVTLIDFGFSKLYIDFTDDEHL